MRIPFTNLVIFSNTPSATPKSVPTEVVPEKSSIMTSIIEKTNFRIKSDISKWRQALSWAESVEYHDRLPLLQIYKEVELDTNISALISLKKDRIEQFEFHIIGENGEDDDIQTGIFRNEWFYEFLDQYVDAMYWGYSVLQINEIKDNDIRFDLIPREYIIPENKHYRKNLYDKVGISYDDPQYTDWLIEIYDGLGDFNKLAPISIWKRSALQNWALFQEIYGQPLRLGKTTSYKPEDRDRLETFLKDMGSSSYAVFDNEMSIEFVATSATDAYNTYNEMIKMLDAEIAKLIIGGSLINEGGASYSQSITHEVQAESKTKSDLRCIEFFVNGYLIPLLNKHNFNITGKFKFEIPKDRAQDWIVDSGIMDRFEVDPEWVAEKYSIPVTSRKNREIF